MSINTDVEDALHGYHSPAGRAEVLARATAEHWGTTGDALHTYEPERVVITGQAVDVVLDLAALVRADDDPGKIRALFRKLNRADLEAALILLVRCMPDSSDSPGAVKKALTASRSIDLTYEDRRILHELARLGPGIPSGIIAGHPVDTVNVSRVLAGHPTQITPVERVLLLELVTVAGGWRTKGNPRGYNLNVVAAALDEDPHTLNADYRRHAAAQKEAMA